MLSYNFEPEELGLSLCSLSTLQQWGGCVNRGHSTTGMVCMALSSRDWLFLGKQSLCSPFPPRLRQPPTQRHCLHLTESRVVFHDAFPGTDPWVKDWKGLFQPRRYHGHCLGAILSLTLGQNSAENIH